jgi:hypothetical protein
MRYGTGPSPQLNPTKPQKQTNTQSIKQTDRLPLASARRCTPATWACFSSSSSSSPSRCNGSSERCQRDIRKRHIGVARESTDRSVASAPARAAPPFMSRSMRHASRRAPLRRTESSGRPPPRCIRARAIPPAADRVADGHAGRTLSGCFPAEQRAPSAARGTPAAPPVADRRRLAGAGGRRRRRLRSACCRCAAQRPTTARPPQQ